MTCWAGGSDATVRFWGTEDTTSGGTNFKMTHALPTKATPLSTVHFTRRNLVLASGSLVLPGSSTFSRRSAHQQSGAR